MVNNTYKPNYINLDFARILYKIFIAFNSKPYIQSILKYIEMGPYHWLITIQIG